MADAVMKELLKYQKVTNDDVEKIAKKIAKEGRNRLKQSSPVGKGNKKGHYAEGWTIKEMRTGVNKFSFVIYNKKKAGLAHLLEKGHRLIQGGRARAIPHIKPVEEWCIKEFEKRVKEMLE